MNKTFYKNNKTLTLYQSSRSLKYSVSYQMMATQTELQESINTSTAEAGPISANTDSMDSYSIQNDDDDVYIDNDDTTAIVVGGSSRPVLVEARSTIVSTEEKTLTIPRKLAYSVGHVMNDLAAAMWFSYFILFYHMVLRIPDTYAGLLLLIGQITDATTTPLVGYLCDKTSNTKYGGRKTWHLIGAIMVAVSVFFFWHECINCSDKSIPYQLPYFALFIILFQMGWATVQVSHLSLIPELTSNENERVGLTSLRYSATIISNLCVFISMFVLLATVNSGGEFAGFSVGSSLQPEDQWIFSGIALGMVGVGSTCVLVFHIGTKEPSRGSICTKSTFTITQQPTSQTTIDDKLPVYKWFRRPLFYLVGVVYMSSRLVVNLTLVYSPLYILDTIGMSRLSVAIFPLVVYLSGLSTSFALKKLNKAIGRYLVYFIGLLFVLSASVWFRFWPSIPASLNNSTNATNDTEYTNITTDSETVEAYLKPLPYYDYTVNLVYIAAMLTGIGGTTLLVTSLSMVADIIGRHSGSSAFVYGAMSFCDKLSNGIVIQTIQLIHPCRGTGNGVCCPQCSLYYRRVLSYAPGGASLVAMVGLLLVVIVLKYKNRLSCGRIPIGGGNKGNSSEDTDGTELHTFTELRELDIVTDRDKNNIVLKGYHSSRPRYGFNLEPNTKSTKKATSGQKTTTEDGDYHTLEDEL